MLGSTRLATKLWMHFSGNSLWDTWLYICFDWLLVPCNIYVLTQKHAAVVIAGEFGGEFNLAWVPPNLIPAKFYIRQNFVECHWSLNMKRQKDGPTLPRKITCYSSTLTQKDLEKTNAKVKRSIEREAAKSQKVLPLTMESTYSLHMWWPRAQLSS